ncbi:MAG: DUF2341 domain-containing protein [Kiritimatiellae bacterium]|nr:DUF2341 domain-containing protein [Kiritimatiellia bacterium]
MIKRFFLILMVVFVPLFGHATDGIWTYNGDAGWTENARWSNTVIASGIDGVADFSQVNIGGTRTITLALNRTIGSIIFADSITPDNNWVLTRNGILTLDVTSGLPVITVLNRTTTINTWIAGTKGFEKRGLGTLVLAATNYFTGPVFLNGGQTTLDFNGGYSPTNNIITNTVPLSIGGGSTLFLQGKERCTNNQAFSSLTVVDGHNFINLVNGRTGQVNLAVGAISRQGTGFLNFNPPTNGSITTTTPNFDGMILDCYATIRTNDWAANNGTNTIVPYTAYFSNMFYSGFNTIVTTNCTMTNATVHSVRFNNNPGFTLSLTGTNVIEAGGAIMFTASGAMGSKISSGTGWLTSGTNELIIIDNHKFDRRSNATQNTNIDAVVTDRGSTSVAVRVVSFSSAMGTANGSLTTFMRANNTYSGGTYLYGGGLYFQADGSLGRVPASPQTNIVAVSGFNWMRPRYPATTDVNRIIHINTNACLVVDGTTFLTINGEITGSGTLLQPPNVGWGFGQTVILNASNTLAGTVEANAFLRAIDGIGLPTNANLRLGGYDTDRGILETTGTFTRALGYGPNQVGWGSSMYDTLYNYSRGGFAAVGGPLTVNIGGNGSNLVWGQAYFNMKDFLALGTVNSTHPVTWVNSIDLNTTGWRYFLVRGTAIMQGVISGVNAGLIKWGPGTLILTTTNTYRETRFEYTDSRLNISFDAALGTAPLAPTNNISFNANGILQAEADLTLGYTRNIFVLNNLYCTLDPSNYTMTVAGKILGQGGFRKAGTGSGKVVLLGENGYWGTTTISNGDLVVNGSLPPESSVIVTNGGFLGGTGIVGGPVTIFSGSGLVPGGTTNGGTLTINNTLTMNPGSIYSWRYGSSPGFVVVSNQMTLTSGETYTLRLYDPDGLGEPANQSFTILTWPDGVTDPETNVTWNIEKPAGGGAEGWTMPQVAVDAANNRILITFQPVGFPAIDNGIGPSSITTNTAVLNGNYTATGATAEVYLYWGTSDGGTNKDNWANAFTNGETSFGSFSNAVTNLYYGLCYYYRCYATNGVGDCWSPVTSSFTTLPPANPADGLRGSLFIGNLLGNEGSVILADSAYFMSYSRVFTGNRVNSILALAEAFQYNVVAPGDISNFSMFPGYQSVDNFATVFSGQMVPRFSGIHKFRWVCDDWGMIYIDFNNDGIFQASDGVAAAPVNSFTSSNITLTAGQTYNIIFLSKDNGGGEAYSFWITEPGQAETLVGVTRQPGMWKYLSGAGLTNIAPSGIGPDSATVNVALSSSGTVSEVWAYWGLVDCTNIASAWANSAYVGSYTDVVTAVNYTPTGLTPDACYYVRFRITNQLMDVWSGVQVFNTTFSPSVYPYKAKITFSGYDKGETLTNFPALVVLNESITNFYYSQFVSGSGTDLRFTDESGVNELSYEMEQWDPGDGLALWLKADAGVVTGSGGNVVTWLDQSGCKNDAWALGGSGPAYVPNTLNGLPVLSFNGSWNYLRNTNWVPGFNLSGEMTYFFVSKILTNGNSAGYFSQKASTDANDYGYNMSFDIEQRAVGGGIGGIKYYHYNGNPNIDIVTNTTIFRIDALRVNTNGTQAYLDGYLRGSSTLSFASALNPIEYSIGARLAPGIQSFGKVDFAEIIIYKTGLTDAQMNQVGYYLKTKYNLTAPNYASAGYSPTTGQSYAWVKVPEFTNNCAIWAYWGNPNATFTPAYTTNGSTWSEGYLGVWHMKNTNVTDSTSNRYNITGWTYATNAKNSAIGIGQGFNGSNAYVGVGNIRVASDISVEAWAYSTNTSQNGIILGKNPVNSQWQLFSEGPSLKWRATAGDVVVPAPVASNWHYVVGMQSGSEASLYVDGVFEVSGTIGAIDNGSGNVEMGRYTPGYYFNGALDEIRLSSVMRSSNWLWASFMNQASNNIFAGFGTPIMISSSVATNITTTSAVLNATLSAPGSFGDVWAFWGVSDGGTNAAGWVSSNFVGTYTDVLSTNISCTVTGLLPDVTCYFTFLATNTQDAVWAKPSRTFKTSFSPSVYSYKMKIKFSGYDKDETLTNFPALVTFSESLPGFMYRQFKSGATDLRFADETETTELNYEIEYWNTNGSSHAWVQVPEFTSNCSIWAYWGYSNAMVAPVYTTNGTTWDFNYASVWHLTNGTTLSGNESTVNMCNGSVMGATATNGVIDGAASFNGADGYITDLDYSLAAYNKITVSFWLNWPNYINNDGLALEYTPNFNSSPRNAFVIGPNAASGGSSGYVAVTMSRSGAYNGGYFARPSAGVWHHYAVTLNRTTGTALGTGVYIDGSPVRITQVLSSDMQSTFFNDKGLYVMSRNGTSLFGQGGMDELRIEGGIRSSNWNWACWLNQASNSFFNTYYSVAGVKNVSASEITATSAVLNATLYASNATFDVSVCWDTNNWGTNITLWANTNYIGSWTNIDLTNISCVVTGLLSDTLYYYKFSATNAVDSLQASDVLDFRTIFSPSLLVTYPYRMQITFSGYTALEVLTNFPALVVLNQGTNGFLYNQLKSTGTDLRFADEATNELNYEIEQWNTNGNSYVWVQVPQLTNNCSIWAYWGNTNAPVPSYLTNGAAWNSNFMGVWHLHSNARDSTANRYDGTVYGGANSIPYAGLIGNAWNFDGLDNAIRVARMIQDDFTIAFWMKANVNSTGGSQWTNGLGLVDANVLPVTNDFGVSYNNQQVTFGSGSPNTNVSSGVYVNDMNWRYVVVTRVKSTGLKKIYVDGIDCATHTGSVASLDLSDSIAFGQLQTWGYYFNGYLDEIEISDVDHSSNWIWACYMNQVSNSVFNPGGSVEGGFLPSINNHNGASLVLMNSANLNGYLVSTGGAATAVSVYWGTTDGGTNKGNWLSREDFVVTGTGLLTTNVTGLVCTEKYYYRFYASNSFGDCWAPSSESFSPSRYRMKVQFGGYDKDETLTNFPALMVFAEGSNGFSYSQCTTTNGSDLRFANSNETAVLNHEVEKWDTNGSSYVWVQVPELVSNGWVWAYWGGSDTNAPSYSTNGATWSQNYLGVWHFNSTNAYKYPDSTSHRFDGLNYGCGSIQGQIGGAVDFDVAPKYIDLTGIGSSSGSYTFHYWVKTVTPSGDTRVIDVQSGRLITSVLSGQLRYYQFNNWNPTGGLGYVNNGVWHHVVYVFDGGAPASDNARVYLDGILVHTSGYYTNRAIGGTVKLGTDYGSAGTGAHFDGAMDELQLSTVMRSSNWIWACFMNQGSNSVFNTTNLAESTTLPLVNNAGGATNVTMNSASLNGYLVSTGGAATAVSIFWGETDGGTNRLAWANEINFGLTDPGPLSTNVTGLSLGSTYYYRYYATNSLGESWAPYSTVFSPVSMCQMRIFFSGYDKPETLTNFPALVVFSEGVNGFSYSQCRSANGGDLRFMNSSEAVVLNHEIEKWDTNGSSYVWVQVPELVDSSTYIWAYWGGADTNPPAYTMNGSTWESGYRSVFHLHESSGMHYDSTSYKNVGKTNGITMQNVDGKIDGAVYFYCSDGDDNVDIYNSSSLENVQEDNFTLEGWLKPADAPVNNGYCIIEKQGNHLGLRYSNMRKFFAEHWTIGNTNYNYTSANISEPGTFYHVAEVFDRTAGNMKLYVDGQYQGQYNFTPGLVAREYGTTTWRIGSAGNATYGANGTIDEVRISAITRSSNWIWACYMNQASNSSFMTSSLLVSNEGGATNVTADQALLLGRLCFDDGVTTYVVAYYGTNDGGSIATNWQNVFDLEDEVVGPLVANVGSLVADTTYYYRYYASNSVRSAWASPSASFFTGQAGIQATDATASEVGPDTGTFTVYRPAAATNTAWIVNYLLEGTASNGVDYQTLNGSVIIPVGQTNATITVIPVEDLLMESDETVNVTLTSGGYVIGPQSNAVVTIRDSLFNSWPYRMKITFPAYTNSQAEILTNFPALVVFSTNITNFSYSTFASPADGGDLRFGNSNGTTMLNYEIEQWNTGSNSYVWVQVPELVDTNTSIWAYWGNKNDTTAPAYTTNGSTWSQGYASVWHLNNAAAESTSNRCVGTKSGNATNATGIIADGQEFFGDTSYQVMSNPPALWTITNQTVEIWLKPTVLGIRQSPWNKAYGGEGALVLWADTGQLIYLYGTTGSDSGTPGSTYWSGGVSGGTMKSNVWEHMVVVRDLESASKTVQWYRNGLAAGTSGVTLAPARAGTLNTLIGDGYAYPFNGVLDELRVSNVTRSSNWVWACYINQVSNNVFNYYGDVTKLLKGTVIIVR